MLARLFASSDEVASDPSVEGCEPVSCEMVSCVNFPLDPFSSGVTDDEHADDARADLSSARPSADEQADAAVSAKLSEDAQARGFIPDDVVVAEAPAPAPAQIPDEDAVEAKLVADARPPGGRAAPRPPPCWAFVTRETRGTRQEDARPQHARRPSLQHEVDLEKHTKSVILNEGLEAQRHLTKMHKRHSLVQVDEDLQVMLDLAVSENEGLLNDPDEEAHRTDVVVTGLPKYIINPNAPWKLKWDLLIGAFILYSVTTVPFLISFDITIRFPSAMFFIDVIVDLCFGIDMILTFRTSYISGSGQLEPSVTRITKRYLSGSFFIDLLSTFPIDRVAKLASGSNPPPAARSSKVLRIVRLTKLLKLARMMRLSKKKNDDDEDVNVFLHPSVVSLLKMTGGLAFTAHLLGCAWHYITIMPSDERRVTWVKTNGVADFDVWDRYLASVYWAFTTITTVGYGDINVSNTSERIFAVISILLGTAVFGYMVGNVTQVMENFSQRDAKYHERLEGLKEYLKSRNLPISTSQRIKKNFKHMYHRKTVFEEADIVSAMPASATRDLIYVEYAKEIAMFDLLTRAHPDFVVIVAPAMKPFFAERGEFIFYEGELGTAVYFLATGSLQLLARDDATEGVRLYESCLAGALVGHVAVMDNEPQPFSCLAAVFCEMYFVAKDVIVQACDLCANEQTRLNDEATAIRAAVANGEGPPPSPMANGGEAFAADEAPAPAPAHGDDEPSSADSVSGTRPRRDSIKPARSTSVKLDQEASGERISPEALWRSTRLFHPESPWKIQWDLWVGIVIVYSVLTVTFRIGFRIDEITGSWLALDDSVDAIFYADILASLNTAAMVGEMVIEHRWQSTSRYLKSWFVVDFLSTFPLDRILGRSPAARAAKVVRALRLLRLAKIRGMNRILEEYEEYLNPSVVRMLKLLMLMCIAAHFDACIFYFAGSAYKGEDGNWIDNYCPSDDPQSDCLSEKDNYSKYVSSIYWAFVTMTTVGYGDISPAVTDVATVIITIMSQVIGTTLLAYVLGTLISIVPNLDPTERNRLLAVNNLKDFIRDLNLEKHQRMSMMRHFNFYLEFKTVFPEDVILGDIPPLLRNPLMIYLHRNNLPRLPLLCDLEARFHGALSVVLPMLQPAAFGKGDEVNGPQQNCREWVFVMDGYVRVSPCEANDLVPPRSHRSGSMFGQLTVFMPDHVPFTLKVVAVAMTRTNVLILSRLQHEALKMLYPQVVKHMSVAPRARVRASSPFHARASLTGFWSPGIRSWTRNS